VPVALLDEPSQAAHRVRAADRIAPNPVLAAAGPVAGSTRSASGMVTISCGLTVRSTGS
jgi:hypothetical protein